MPEMETREVFLPAKVLESCLPNWETAEDDELARAVGEAMDHAYWHWRWVLAVRAHKCRLVVVQGRDAKGEDMHPHYQIGDLFTLSEWHPERAIAEGNTLLAEAGDGLTFDLPVDEAMLNDWYELAGEFDLEEDTALEVLATAMVLMDEAHDVYVEELGDDFYVATRGLERDLQLLVAEEAGQWSLSTPRIVDRFATVASVHVFMEPSADPKKPVPVVIAPEDMDEEESED